MSREPVTVAIIGAGQRGKAYALYAHAEPSLCRIVAVAEPRPRTRALFGAAYSLPLERQFTTWQELHDASTKHLSAAKEKIADAVLVAVQDHMHVEVVEAFASQGYHILCEKPLATSPEECIRIADAAKKSGKVLGIGHVLRYTPYNNAVIDVIRSGELGRPVNIVHVDPIGAFHFAHSYVRGMWAKEKTSSFSLLTKGCHDIDILCHYLYPVLPKRVSSFGSLSHFKGSNKPVEALGASRCMECPHEADCHYSAMKIYLEPVSRGDLGRPACSITDGPPDIENVTAALRDGQFGRCVWESDNDVVDHQVVNVENTDGSTCSFTMVAFTQLCCERQTQIYFTHGQLIGDMTSFTITDFRTKATRKITPEVDDNMGHKGGDMGLMRSFVRAVKEERQDLMGTTVDEILKTHLTVFAAEKSRKQGRVIDVEAYEQEVRRFMVLAHIGGGDDQTKPRLSIRGEVALQNSAPSLALSRSLYKDLFHPMSNPNGFTSLGIAENSLQHAELSHYFSSRLSLTDVDLAYGTDPSGSVRLYDALATFMNGYFAPYHPVLPEHIVTGAGCGPVLDQLAYYLTDNGDAILVAAPYYSGFNSILQSRSHARAIGVPVDMDDLFGPSAIEAFECTIERVRAEGTTVRAVLLCNPHNPIGQCYPRETILAYARFCQRHNLHLISDEIYALSVFPTNDVPNPTPFISALSIDFLKEADCDPSRVSLVYGMSKDFNSNGLRVGVLVSQHNEDLLNAVRSASILMKVSSPADILWSALLNDATYLPVFISENKKRLREAYEFVTAWLRFHNIPYTPSNAGHFLMADFGRFLPSHEPISGDLLPSDDNGAAKERQLSSTLIEHKVYMGSATAFSYPVPGWFRLTFSVRRDYLVVGLARIEKAVGLPPCPLLHKVATEEPIERAARAEFEGSKDEVWEVVDALGETVIF